MLNWLRGNKIAAGILTIIRLYLGYTWITAGFHKITGGFAAASMLKMAASNPVKGPDGSVVYGAYVTFLKSFAIPNAHLFNVLIPYGEFLVGLGLILGCLTTAAMFFGLVMNFSYLTAGFISTNPEDILLGAIVLFAGFNAGKFGLDYWVIPFIRKVLFKKDLPAGQKA